jgi:hypothetical protein
MWRQWSKRRLFYTAVGLELIGVLIMALGAAGDSGFITTLGGFIAFFISPIVGLLWLFRVVTK